MATVDQTVIVTPAAKWNNSAMLLKHDCSPKWRYILEPFQEAFFRSPLTAAEVEAMCGWRDSYVGRVLGLRDYTSGHCRDARRLRARSLGYKNAVKLARALDMNMIELGL